MRVPKRTNVGGLIAKALKRGIFKLGPKEHARINRENKVGRFSPEVQSRLGQIGGAKKSPAKTSACRKNGTKSRTRHDPAKQAVQGRRGANAMWADAVAREMQRWNKGRFKKGQSANPKGRPEIGKLAPLAAHNRWHVQRSIRSEACPLCNPRPA